MSYLASQALEKESHCLLYRAYQHPYNFGRHRSRYCSIYSLFARSSALALHDVGRGQFSGSWVLSSPRAFLSCLRVRPSARRLVGRSFVVSPSSGKKVLKSVSLRIAPRKLTPCRLAPLKFAFVRLAFSRLAPSKSASSNLMFRRSACVRSASLRPT